MLTIVSTTKVSPEEAEIWKASGSDRKRGSTKAAWCLRKMARVCSIRKVLQLAHCGSCIIDLVVEPTRGARLDRAHGCWQSRQSIGKEDVPTNDRHAEA